MDGPGGKRTGCAKHRDKPGDKHLKQRPSALGGSFFMPFGLRAHARLISLPLKGVDIFSVRTRACGVPESIPAAVQQGRPDAQFTDISGLPFARRALNA